MANKAAGVEKGKLLRNVRPCGNFGFHSSEESAAKKKK